MKKANQDIRNLLDKERIFYWEVAEKLGMKAPNFTVMMRTKLSEEKREKVLKAIKEIKLERIADL